MDMSTINWLAVLVAGISAFVVGGIWYSPGLFGNAWMKENNLQEEDIKRSNKGRTFGWAFILSLVMSANLAMFLADAKTDFVWGMTAGFLAGIWVFCGLAITAMFELRSWKYVFINGGYQLLALVLMGAIIGVWR
jgi:hypothetical protein